jgi:hypothetical protein
MCTEINAVSKMWKYCILKMKIWFLQVLSGVWNSAKHLKCIEERTINLYLTSKSCCAGYQGTIVYSSFRCFYKQLLDIQGVPGGM